MAVGLGAGGAIVSAATVGVVGVVGGICSGDGHDVSRTCDMTGSTYATSKLPALCSTVATSGSLHS